MKKTLSLFLLLTVCAACKPSSDTTLGGSTSSSTSPGTTPPTATVTVPLKLKISAIYDGTEWEVPLSFLELTENATECTVSDGTPTRSCTIKVEEARLYFSTLKLQYSWYSTACKLLNFQPYYYKASNANAILPWGGTDAVDCTDPLNATCWGGIAPLVVPDFPRNGSLIHLPNEGIGALPLSETVTFPSAYSRRYNSNRNVTNDMSGDRTVAYTDADLGTAYDAYVANTFVDYSFTCRDDWYDPQTYRIDLFISDEDTDGAPDNPATDHFPSWKHL